MGNRPNRSGRATTAPRLGPRPLPLHLGIALSTWLSSLAGLPSLRNGSPLWKASLAKAAADLAKEVASVAPETFVAAVESETRRRLDQFLTGLEAYRKHPYRRNVPEPATAWSEGTTRLLDYATADDSSPARQPVLVIPSLINRAYVLDLTRPRSLLRALTRSGLRPMLLDWDRPGPVERGFGLEDYVSGRLQAALDAVLEATGRRPIVLGYCMGGLFALALAIQRVEDVKGLALLATPWDFHADRPELSRALAASLTPHWFWVDQLGELPVDLLQTLFTALDPFLVMRKFSAFARLDPASPEAEAFVALEDWVNDGVPLAAPAARECVTWWYGENRPGRGEWRIGSQSIIPERVTVPTLVVVPERDRIVPPASADALATGLLDAVILRPPLGHIGMVVGKAARRRVWPALTRWLSPA